MWECSVVAFLEKVWASQRSHFFGSKPTRSFTPCPSSFALLLSSCSLVLLLPRFSSATPLRRFFALLLSQIGSLHSFCLHCLSPSLFLLLYNIYRHDVFILNTLLVSARRPCRLEGQRAKKNTKGTREQQGGEREKADVWRNASGGVIRASARSR